MPSCLRFAWGLHHQVADHLHAQVCARVHHHPGPGLLPCGQYYAAGTVEVQVAVWKVSQLVARGEVDRGKELAREGGEQYGDREGRGH